MSKTSSKYKSWIESNRTKHSFKDYLIRYSLLLCSIITGITLFTTIFQVDIFIFPIIFFGKLAIMSYIVGVLAVWVHLRIYTRRNDINNLIWIRRKKNKSNSAKGQMVGGIVLVALLSTFIYQYLKYGTLFIAIYKINGDYQILSWLENVEAIASILIIVFIMIGIVDVLLSLFNKNGLLVILPIIQLFVLYSIYEKVFTVLPELQKPVESLDNYVFMGVYVVFILAVVQVIITLVFRLINYVLLIHDGILKEN